MDQPRHEGRRALLQVRAAAEQQGLDNSGAESLGLPVQQLIHHDPAVWARRLAAPAITTAVLPDAVVAAAAAARAGEEQQCEGEHVPLQELGIPAPAPAPADHPLHGLEEAGAEDAGREALPHDPCAGGRALAEPPQEGEHLQARGGVGAVAAGRGPRCSQLGAEELEEGDEGGREGGGGGVRGGRGRRLALAVTVTGAARGGGGGEEERAQVLQPALGGDQGRHEAQEVAGLPQPLLADRVQHRPVDGHQER